MVCLARWQFRYTYFKTLRRPFTRRYPSV